MPRWSGFGLLILIVVAGCARVEPPEQRGELVVAVRSMPSYYQVENDKVTVLVETAEAADQIDLERAKAALSRAESAIKSM